MQKKYRVKIICKNCKKEVYWRMRNMECANCGHTEFKEVKERRVVTK